MQRRKLGLMVGVALVATIIGIAAVSSAAPAPGPITLACAAKSNGLVKYVTSASECPSKQGTLIEFKVSSPVSLCRQRDGSVRLMPPRDCTKASGTMFTVPSNTPAYFCVNLSTTGRTLRYVSDPSQCTSGETTFVSVNHAPTDIALSPASIPENKPAGTTVGTLSAIDPDAGDSFAFTLAPGSGDTDNGSFAIIGTTLMTKASFDYETQSSYWIRVQVKDRLGLTYDEIFTITVTDVAEGPIVTTTSGPTAYTENAAAVAVEPALTVSDDGANLAGATVRISAGFQPGDVLTFIDQLGITATGYNAVTGVLTLSGSSSVANYQTALRSVGFHETGDNPSASRTVEFKANDGTFDSAPATKAIAITPVNDAPVVATSPSPLSFTEGDAAKPIDPGVTVADADSASVATATVQVTGNYSSAQDVLAMPTTVGIASSYNAATGTLTLTGPASPAALQAALRTVTYRNTSNNPSTAPRTVTFIASDGALSSAPATRAINISATDNPPDVDNSGGSLAYTENDPATAIDTNISITDVDSATLTGATVKITDRYFATQDRLALPAQPSITAAAFDSATGTLTLSGMATIADYETALEAVTYRNTSDDPSTPTRTVTYTARDAGGFGAPDTHGVTVTAVDDPPVAVNDAAPVAEDAAATPVAVLANETDVDGGPKSIDSVTQPAHGTVVRALDGTGLTYKPDSNYCNTPPGTSPDTFTYTLTPGLSTATVSMTVTCVDDAPTAVADSFDAIGNTDLFVGTTKGSSQAGKEMTGSVLSNDTDPDTAHANVVTEPRTDAPTTLGGKITIESDGNFTYHPPAGAVNTTDTFTYRVCDASPCTSSTVANTTGTLNLPLTGQIWYVKNNQAGGDGTSDGPFDTIAEAESADSSGDTVFVFGGDHTSTNLDTGFRMETRERLIGQAVGLAIDPDGAAGSLPVSTLLNGTSGTAPTLTTTETEDVVTLNDQTSVNGVDIDPGAGGGGIGGGIAATGQAAESFTIANLHVNDTAPLGTQPGIELDGTTGSSTIAGVEVDTSGATGVRLNSAGTVGFQNSGTISINTSGAKALDVGGGTIMAASSVIDDITVTGSDSGAVRIINVSGGLTLGDLSLQTMSSPTAALDIASSNFVSIAAAGTDTVSATGGPALDIRNSFNSLFEFDSVSSTNSTTDGIKLDTNLDSPFVADAGAISGAAGIAVNINGAAAAIRYDGAINDGSGPLSVAVTHRTGGAVTLSGNISDGPDAGGGIALSDNSGGTTTFSGTSKVLNTGASTAVSSTSSSPSSTLSFTNGGLDIDATSGAGFDAVSGGTISVEGSGNTIDTTTGLALRIQSSPIADSDVTLQGVSSNGASSGIVLNTTTNTGGRLSVTGNGETCSSAETCSGGAIQNSTGDGISLSNVPGRVSLSHMQVSDSGADGIHAVSVNGADLSFGRIVDNGDAAGENGLDYFNVTGDSSIADTVVTGSAVDNLRVASSSASSAPSAFSLDVTGSTFASNSQTMGGSGLEISLDRAGSADVNITGSTFDANREAAVVVDGGTSATTVNVRLKSNTMTGGNTGAPIFENGIFFSGSKAGHTSVEVDQNTISGTRGRAVVVESSADSTTAAQFDATITSNTIGNGTAFSGTAAAGADAVVAQSNGSGSTRFAIRNNTIRSYAARGLLLFAPGTSDGTATADYTVTQNTISDPSGNVNGGLTVASGNTGGAVTMCADVGGAGVENNLGSASATGRTDVILSLKSPADLRLPGFDGGNVEAYIAGRNLGLPTVSTSGLAPTGQTGGCALPAPLPPP